MSLKSLENAQKEGFDENGHENTEAIWADNFNLAMEDL